MKTIILTITLLFAINASAQTFKNEGFRIVTNEIVSESKLKKILAFNFKDYRKQNHSSIIKIIDGPTIELFSISEMKTGVKPIPSEANKVKIKVPQHNSEEPRFIWIKDISTIRITSINIFNSPENTTK